MSNIPISVCGTVATDPHPRTLPTGRACASFRLAVNHWRVDKNTGEFVEDTPSWFGVDCYGPIASNVGTSITKGMSVVVQGHLRIRKWETDQRSGIAPTIIADHLGPDLRYGTAHYQKAAGTQSGKPSAQTQSAEAEAPKSAWGGLGDSPGEMTSSAGRGGYGAEAGPGGGEDDAGSGDGRSAEGRPADGTSAGGTSVDGTTGEYGPSVGGTTGEYGPAAGGMEHSGTSVGGMESDGTEERGADEHGSNGDGALRGGSRGDTTGTSTEVSTGASSEADTEADTGADAEVSDEERDIAAATAKAVAPF